MGNPVPRVAHPDWLVLYNIQIQIHNTFNCNDNEVNEVPSHHRIASPHVSQARRVREKSDRFQQQRISSMFKRLSPEEAVAQQSAEMLDIEDMGGGGKQGVGRPVVHRRKKNKNATTESGGQAGHNSLADSDAMQTEGAAPADADAGEGEGEGEGEGGADEEVPLLGEEGVTMQIWLKDRKKRWRALRAQRRRQRQEIYGNTSVSIFGNRDRGKSKVVKLSS